MSDTDEIEDEVAEADRADGFLDVRVAIILVSAQGPSLRERLH